MPLPTAPKSLADILLAAIHNGAKVNFSQVTPRTINDIRAKNWYPFGGLVEEDGFVTAYYSKPKD